LRAFNRRASNLSLLLFLVVEPNGPAFAHKRRLNRTFGPNIH
jgi:hypothetical protein